VGQPAASGRDGGGRGGDGATAERVHVPGHVADRGHRRRPRCRGAVAGEHLARRAEGEACGGVGCGADDEVPGGVDDRGGDARTTSAERPDLGARFVADVQAVGAGNEALHPRRRVGHVRGFGEVEGAERDGGGGVGQPGVQVDVAGDDVGEVHVTIGGSGGAEPDSRSGGPGGGSGLNQGAYGENGQDKTDIGGGVNPAAYNNALGGPGGDGMFGNLGGGGRGSDGTGLSGAAAGGAGAGEQVFRLTVAVTAGQWDVTIGAAGLAGTASGAGTASSAGKGGFFIVEYFS